jgi:hypothetical protein
LAFAWLSPTVLGLISGSARIFSVFCDASTDEKLQLMYDGFGELPGVTAVKQN